MASSNRHWPSMFKSKPCNTTTTATTTTTTTPQWQHDINHACLVSSCQRPSPYSSSSVPAGNEERSPEPKPRWNPKPEQIRILETIFNSGLVNPPRDEIRRIRAQLQEYGQVGDANVFYWFQNRKSRSKHKQKHLQNTKSSSSSSSSTSSSHVNQTTSALTLTAPSSSSSSSEKSSPPKCTDKPFPIGATGVSNLIDVSNSPTASVNQLTYFQSSGTSTGEFTPHHDPFFFPVQQTTGGNNNNNSTVFSTQGFCFSELPNVVQFPGTEQSIGGTCSGFLLGELMLNHGFASRKDEYSLEQNRKFLQEQQQLNYMTTTTNTSTILIPTTSIITTTSVAVPISTTSTTASTTTINQIQGVGESDAMGGPTAAAKSTVFINDVAIEISVGPLNVRQTFGDDVVLIHPSGQPVLTNEWGVTLHSLTPGAFYYLVPMNC